jgi:MFS transporter, DHA1 family, tetracycline resistance protein
VHGAPIHTPSLTGAVQAEPAERGALLGAVETLQELCEAVGHSGYGRLFAYFISDAAPVRLPGAPFIAAGSLMLAALGFIKSTLMAHPEASARFL